jgi:hypothetical protein
MESLSDVIQHLLATARDGGQEPTITPSQVARASGLHRRAVRAYLDSLVERSTLRRAPYRLADCPCCGSSLRVPFAVTVGYEPAAPPIPLRLASVWCPGCQQLRSCEELHAEPAYLRATARDRP